MLKIKNLQTTIKSENKDKPILKGVNLEIKNNFVHVLMGPNGSGKSTLAHVLMGNSSYEVTGGTVTLNNKDLLKLQPNERSQAGVFLSFQYPSEVSGVSIENFLRLIYNKHHEEQLSPAKFRKILHEKMAILEIDQSFAERYLNEGFSGGEKKRMEILQMLIVEPKLAILDETDSGLDIDALKTVAKAINGLKLNNEMSVLLITHYTRILSYIEPNEVSIMQDGKITQTGGKELADELEDKGYAPFGE